MALHVNQGAHVQTYLAQQIMRTQTVQIADGQKPVEGDCSNKGVHSNISSEDQSLGDSALMAFRVCTI